MLRNTAADEISEEGAREILKSNKRSVSPQTCHIVRCSSKRKRFATPVGIDQSMFPISRVVARTVISNS